MKKGRKPLWEQLNMEDRLEAVKGWALEGSTDIEMMEMLGVKKDTFYQWKKDKPEFSEAIKKGRFESNGEILNSAFNQTKGYYVRVTEPMKRKIDQFEEVIEMVEYDKYFPPNPALTIFMMKNRLGYRDKQDVEHSGGQVVNIVDNVEDFEDEEG